MAGFRKLLSAIGGALVLAVGTPLPSAAQTPPPVEAYAALPAIQSVSVSPDGSVLAYLRRQDGMTQIIAQTRTGELLAAADAGDALVTGLDWVSPDHIAISLQSTEHFPLGGYKGVFQVIDILNVRTQSNVRALKSADRKAFNSIFQWRGGQYRGRPVLYAVAPTLEEGDLTIDVYRVDLDSGRGTRLVRGASDTRGYVLNADGEPVARVAYQSENGLWRLSSRTGTGWREIHTVTALLDQPSVSGRGRTEDSLLLNVKQSDGGYETVEVALEDGAVRETFDVPGEIDAMFYDNRGLLVGLGYTDQVQEYRIFEPRLEEALNVLRPALPGRQVTLSSFSDDYSIMAFYVEGTGETGGYYLYDAAAKKLSRIGRAYPGIPADAMGEVRLVRYKAADGLDLFGYLTLPAGREAKNLPVVMLPHGGPQSRDYAGFDWLSQGIASRGYAVFQPQFRGSDGFGQDFLEAGYGEWGRKMQSDVSDGLRHLVAAGTVDAERACIVGWSYGGYAALAGMTLESGTYRCAVAVAPVSDLRAMLEDEQRQSGARGDDSSSIRYWRRFMGVESPTDPRLDELSPARFADKVKGPILLIHGRDDTVVPYNQSTIMLRALGGEGPNARLIGFDGQNHSLLGPAERLVMLRSTLEFLQEHNPAD